MSDNLSALKLEVKNAGKSFYEAGAIYYAAIEAACPTQELRTIREQCIALGEEYKSLLYKLLAVLERSKISDKEITVTITEVKELIELLETELPKLYSKVKG